VALGVGRRNCRFTALTVVLVPLVFSGVAAGANCAIQRYLISDIQLRKLASSCLKSLPKHSAKSATRWAAK